MSTPDAAGAATALLAFTPALSWATDTTSNQYPGGITQRIAGKNPIAASISPGHLAITAKGIYKVTKVTYGRHIEPYTDMSTGTHPTRNVYLRATLVVKIEGQPVDGGPEQQIDASGITEVEVDTGRRVGYDNSIQCKKLGEKNWWS